MARGGLCLLHHWDCIYEHTRCCDRAAPASGTARAFSYPSSSDSTLHPWLRAWKAVPTPPYITVHRASLRDFAGGVPCEYL